MDLTQNEVNESLRGFVTRRDDLLHEDDSAFDHLLNRFLAFCDTDRLVQSVLSALPATPLAEADLWWPTLQESRDLAFPPDAEAELSFRYALLKSLSAQPNLIHTFGFSLGHSKMADSKALFRTLVLRPFADELSHRLGEAANLATPQERALQAVPLTRIPSPDQVRIFLSHKSVDKPLVNRYYVALKELGYDPWLDQPAMPAGVNLERGMLQGFQESCAAVFFITDNFRDESYLAAEIDYAIIEKRKKGKKFAIITLRYPESVPVPGLLMPYVYKDVQNDLEGLYEVVRALPVELGPVRWKAQIVAN